MRRLTQSRRWEWLGVRQRSDRSVQGPVEGVRGRSGGVGVLLEVLSVCVFASLLISAGSAWATVRATRAHTEALVTAVLTIERAVGSLDVEMPGITTITDAISYEISSAVEDVLGSMHVPTGADHLLATLSMGAQAFFARKFGPAGPGLASMIEGAMPPDAVGDAESVGTV